MSGIGLFVVGAIVTLITSCGIGLLVWGAVLDGRDEQESRARLGAGPASPEASP
jgi:hypothetical protein